MKARRSEEMRPETLSANGNGRRETEDLTRRGLSRKKEIRLDGRMGDRHAKGR